MKKMTPLDEKQDLSAYAARLANRLKTDFDQSGDPLPLAIEYLHTKEAKEWIAGDVADRAKRHSIAPKHEPRAVHRAVYQKTINAVSDWLRQRQTPEMNRPLYAPLTPLR